MDLKIITKQENPLLSRKEIEAEVNFLNEPTPKKVDIKKRISSMEKADDKLVVVKKIANDFGAGKADVLVYVYTSGEELKKTEPRKREKKGTKPAEEVAEEEVVKEGTKEVLKEEEKEEAKEK